ncbi:MAG: DUF6198 family protein [Clostridia bacterium]|nr:DUF6198 family protein [Clostridia bacterium]
MKELKEKRIGYSEYAYFFGMFFFSLSAALMAKSGFGVSLSSAPAYVLYYKASITEAVTFGTAEYTFQAFILLFLFALIGKWKKAYLFSFASAVIYAFSLDAITNILDLLPINNFIRVGYLLVAAIIAPLGLALLTHTYITPFAYTFFQNEVSFRFNKDKILIYWICNVTNGLIAVGLSFYFFGVGHFIGVNIGTLLYTLTCILLIRPWENFIEKRYKFRDKSKKLRRHFK